MLKNKHKVKDRWYGRSHKEDKELSRKRYVPHAALPRKPQFEFEQLYRSVFTEERRYVDNQVTYVKLPDRYKPSGIEILDLYIDRLHRGGISVSGFCKELGVLPLELNGFIFLLTGMTNEEFRTRWMLMRADELLRYSDLPLTKIGARSGIGSHTNLYHFYQRECGCSPFDRRYMLRQPNDAGRYR